jgi:ribose 5-phosphate isomerase A
MNPETSDIWPAATDAAEMVESEMVVGLGTGRAASMFVRALAVRVAKGLSIRGVPTSKKTEALARELAIPLASLEEVDRVDIDIDGADEVSPELDLIKGHGGALLRERIVASFSSRFVVLVGEEKLVTRLGERVAVPVEVIPFGISFVQMQLQRMGGKVSLRQDNDVAYRTDNGNAILNVRFDVIESPTDLEQHIRLVPGVVDCGLFLGMTDMVLVQTTSGVKRLGRR